MYSYELVSASRLGDSDSVRNILKAGKADVNSRDILDQNIFMQFKSIFFFYFILIKNDLWDLIYCFNWPALICAAQQGHTEVVRLLLSQPGILINYSIINNQNYSWNLMPILNNILN